MQTKQAVACSYNQICLSMVPKFLNCTAYNASLWILNWTTSWGSMPNPHPTPSSKSSNTNMSMPQSGRGKGKGEGEEDHYPTVKPWGRNCIARHRIAVPRCSPADLCTAPHPTRHRIQAAAPHPAFRLIITVPRRQILARVPRRRRGGWRSSPRRHVLHARVLRREEAGDKGGEEAVVGRGE